MHRELLLGPPGTSKTSTLIEEAHVALRNGMSRDRIAFVSFTNAAIDEAKVRINESEMPHFRTIHSLAFRAMKRAREDVVDRSALATFAEEIGEELTLTREPGSVGRTVGDAYLRAAEIAGASIRSLDSVWARIDEHLPGTTFDGCRLFVDAYAAFKQRAFLLDYNDLLRQYIEHGEPLDVSLAFVDEAQDLTALQWRVVWHAFANAQRLVIAGDDDQAIYEWAGVDLDTFFALSVKVNRLRVLHQSFRLPHTIWERARVQARRIARRYEKNFLPREGNRGLALDHASLDSVTLDGSNVMVLARNEYLLDAVEQRLRREGILYRRGKRESTSATDVETIKAWLTCANDVEVTAVSGETIKRFYQALGRPAPSVKRHATELLDVWNIDARVPWYNAFEGWSHERRAYYLNVLSSGRKLSAPPTVTLSTIHAAKGKQASTVVLLTDVSARTARAQHEDSEHRVFYVGITRAIETLHIVAPHQGRGYPL